jgi:hypothetical protein
MKLLYRVLFVTVVIASSCSVAQTKDTKKSFPTNFSDLDFNNLETRDGDMIAFDGIITQKKNSRNNTPFYLLELGDSKRIWTVLMFKNEANKIGDQVRVVGYLTQVKDKKQEEDYLGNDKYMVIAMGLVDLKNENFLFLDGAYKQRQQWVDGKIPTQ